MPRLSTIPADRFQNFVWWFITRNAQSQTDIDKLKAKLWQPPPQLDRDAARRAILDKRSPWAPENEAAAFSSFKAGLGATGVKE